MFIRCRAGSSSCFVAPPGHGGITRGPAHTAETVHDVILFADPRFEMAVVASYVSRFLSTFGWAEPLNQRTRRHSPPGGWDNQ